MKNKIIPVNMKEGNSYIIESDKGLILVDTGVKGKLPVIRDSLKSLGYDIKDIKLIIVTHVHSDHVGSLKEIKEISNAKVIVHKDEADILEKGYYKLPKGTMLFAKFFRFMCNNILKGINKFESVNADIKIDKEGFMLNEYGVDGEIIYTPGHTIGSLSILVNKEYAIVGDVVFNVQKNNMYPFYVEDDNKVLDSWKKLLNFNCLAYYPGHGEKIEYNALKMHLESKIGNIK